LTETPAFNATSLSVAPTMFFPNYPAYAEFTTL
jgi:hypothetical protein